VNHFNIANIMIKEPPSPPPQSEPEIRLADELKAIRLIMESRLQLTWAEWRHVSASFDRIEAALDKQ
jgi:hypothetical protein